MRGFIPPQDIQEKIFVKKALQAVKKVEDGAAVQFSLFLNLRQQELFKAYTQKKRNISVEFLGGYDGDFERAIARLTEKDDTFKDTYYPPVTILKAKLNDSKVSHKDFLGATMSLKISRDYIGDIFFCDMYVYIIVHNNVKNIIINELTHVKNLSVSFAEIDGTVTYKKDSILTSTATVPSMRIDAIISALFGISRAEAVKNIKQGNVQVSHFIVDSPSYEIINNDIISVAQKGKYKVFCDGIKSRKDRIFINFIKY